MSDTAAARNRASRIRRAVAEGKATPAQRSWLTQYEATKGKPGRKPRAAFGAAAPVTSSIVDNYQPAEPIVEMSAAPGTGPAPVEVPPLPMGDVSASPPISGDPNAPPQTTPLGSPEKETGVRMIVDMAADAWRAGMDALKERTGAAARMFPDEFIDKIWKPAAMRLGMKYLPDSVGGDVADIAAVAVPPAMTIYTASKVAKQLAAGDERKAPAIGAKPELKVVQDEAPAHSAQGGKSLRDEIRRAKAPDMPKGSVF